MAIITVLLYFKKKLIEDFQKNENIDFILIKQIEIFQLKEIYIGINW